MKRASNETPGRAKGVRISKYSDVVISGRHAYHRSF